MKIGKVVRIVEASRTAPCFGGQTFLLVQTPGETLVATDRVGAAPGDAVLLTTGPAAAKIAMEAPVDAAAVAILREALIKSARAGSGRFCFQARFGK